GDSMLTAGGNLKAERLKGAPEMDMKVIELTDRSPLAKTLQDEAYKSVHRSIYLPLLRGVTPRSLEVFDFAEQGMVTGSRDTTTVAAPALYLLNDPFVRRQALNLAGRLLRRDEPDDEARVDLAYRLTLGRPATTAESRRARASLADCESATLALIASATEVVGTKGSDVRAVSDPTSDETQAATGASRKRPAPPVNPDEVPPEEAPVQEEVVRAP